MKPGHLTPDKEAALTATLIRYLERLAPATSEVAYNRLAGYWFARRYAGGNTVADLGWEGVGYGSCILAEVAESVAGLTNSLEAVGLARTTHQAPNTVYTKVDFPELPYAEGHFDLVVALGVVENLERPETLAREARRVLKQDGTLIISVPDKRVLVEGGKHTGNQPQRGMYVHEFRELLEQHFGSVLVYRQGAVAGGYVFPASSGKTVSAPVESASFSLSAAHVSAEPPTTHSVIAVCGGTGAVKREEPLLVLDRDQRVFDECEDRAEDVDLLRAEIRNLEQSEVQSFWEARRLRESEIAYLRARVRRSEAEAQRLKTHLYNMQRSMTWRIFEPYRRLRAKIDTIKKSASEGKGESSGRRLD